MLGIFHHSNSISLRNQPSSDCDTRPSQWPETMTKLWLGITSYVQPLVAHLLGGLGFEPSYWLT